MRYLLAAADRLEERLQQLGRRSWLAEELDQRFGPEAALVQNPDTAWRRVAGRGKVRGAQLGTLVSVAAWREREARERDMPATWLVKDATLVELARRQPKTAAQAEGVRGLNLRRGGRMDGLLRAIAEAGDPPPATDTELTGDLRRRVKVVLPLASSVLQARCAEAGIASELVATRADVEALIAHVALGDADSLPLLRGWRRELAGDRLLALLRGEVSLRVLPGAPHISESQI